MDKTLVLVWLLLSLSACEPGGRSITHSQSVNGKATFSTKVQAWDDHGLFECADSLSGSCRVVVFACQVEGRDCSGRELTRFLLKAGESRRLEHLPRHWDSCIDFERGLGAPSCRPG